MIGHASPSPSVTRPLSSQRSKPATPALSSYSNANNTLLHESLITKNKKLSMMIRTVHSYMTHIEDLDWIMTETEKIMKNYMKSTAEKAGAAHKIQI